MSAFDELRAGLAADRSQFCKDSSALFYGADRPGSNVSQGKRDEFWLQSPVRPHRRPRGGVHADLLAFLAS